MVDINSDDMPLDKAIESADCFFNAFDCVGKFVLIGGEPFLYSHLAELIEYIGSKYREKIIFFTITTNGTIIHSHDIIKICKKYNITIRVSDYCKKIDQLRNKKIIIYGAGRVGRDFYEQMSRYKDIEIVAWVDKNSDNISYDYYKVMPPENINDFNYDYIVIAILKEEVAKVIRRKLVIDGVDENKIIYNKPEECFKDIFDV